MDIKNNSFVMIPSQIWEGILSEIKEIKTYIKNNKGEEGLGDYITEDEAKKLLSRKTTWFWGMRKDGNLKFSKVGNRIYYLKHDIINLIVNSS